MTDRTRTVRVDVVPHTHWDREWYSPFPTFRLRLVDLLDELLPRLSNGELDHFQLDGQMAVVDDYLGLRPDEADRLRDLARSGRITMGPWYVLPDEFLVSGETHVRNLQLGMRRAEGFGGAMQVGYLPDMFGHIAQMPQILRQFGFTDAVVWRGVPSSVDRPAFWWEAPDGSTVRATYLPTGYGNGSDLSDDPARVRRRIDRFRERAGDLAGNPILLMAGMDHEVPPAHLATVLRDLDAQERARGNVGDEDEDEAGVGVGVGVGVGAGDGERVGERPGDGATYRLRVCSLADHLADTSSEGLPKVHGEMRSGHRANVLMGVASNRVDVKQSAARAERYLERVAEPLAALWLSDPDHGGDARRWTTVFDAAWLEVIRNAAHDSICACSHDEVVDAVLHRYSEAIRLAKGVAERAVAAAGARMARPGAVVLNASAGERSGLVELDLPADATIEEGGNGTLLQVVTSSAPASLWGTPPATRVVALSPTVPGYGWSRWEPVEPSHPVRGVGSSGLTNGLVTVQVDADDGTFSIDGLGGFGRLVDEGDAGDTYNWCPPEHDLVVDAPTTVTVTLVEQGPIRGRIVIESRYVLPEHLAIDGQDDLTTGWDGDEVHRRVGEVDQVFRTTLELRADDPVVRVSTAWDQRARDHRLRVHLPLPTPTDRSEAEDAYAVVSRPLWIEGGPNEWGVPTFPSRRFVSAGGLTVTHEGLCEYELIDLRTPDGSRWSPREHGYGIAPPDGTVATTLALTLVRSTAWLSRGPMPSRPEPAGPFVRLEGAEALVPLELRYAISLDPAGSEQTPDHAYDVADDVWNHLLVTVAPGGGDLGERGSLLRVLTTDAEAPGRTVVDALLRDDRGRLVLRVHAVDDRPAALSVTDRTGAVVDLRGRELDTFTGRLDVDPHRIVTVRMD